MCYCGFQIIDYVNYILTGIFSRNIHRLQRVQNSLALVVACSTPNTISTLNSLHWLPIQQRINFKLASLVHRSLHNAGPQYLSSLLHLYTPSRQLRSASLNLLSEPRINTALASRGFRHAGPSFWNSSLILSSHTVFQSNLKTRLFLVQASLAPPVSIHALLIRHNHVDFCVLKLYIITLCLRFREIHINRTWLARAESSSCFGFVRTSS